MVRQRRAPVQAPSFHEVPGLATTDKEAVEGHRGGLEMEAAHDPVGSIPVGGEGYRRRFGVSAHHESGMRWHRESAPRGEGGGGERRGEGPRPALECTLSFVFSFGGCGDVFLFFLSLV